MAFVISIFVFVIPVLLVSIGIIAPTALPESIPLPWKNKKPPAEIVPRCLHCGYDLRATPNRCPECGRFTPDYRRRRLARLRDHWPASPIDLRREEPGETEVVALVTDDRMGLGLMRQQLEARGIRARIVERDGEIAGHRLLVWSADAELAKAVIDKMWIEETDRPASS